MTKEEILEKHRNGIKTITEKFLDSLYEEDEKNPSAVIYEDLRRVVRGKQELTLLQWNLVSLLCSYGAAKFRRMADDSTKAAEIFDEIMSTIQEDLRLNS